MTSPHIPLVAGARRVLRAPALVAGVFALTILFSLPLAVVLRGMIEQHLGNSLAADTAATGVNYQWWQEFTAQASGIGVTFKPTIIGFGAVLDNLSTFIENDKRPVVIVGVSVVYMLAWLFLAGGIIDRLARQKPTRAFGFWQACGVYFFRFLRLAVVMGAVYGVLFGIVHPWLFDHVYDQVTREMTVERTAFAVRVGLYVVFGLLLGVCNVVFDYAKVRAVVEDRRSMMGALGAGLRFIGQHLGSVVLLYAASVLVFFAVVAAYGVVAPGAGASTVGMWAGVVIGQIYILARLVVKLLFWASEASLFQSQFAHAGYVAAPAAVWPESPAAGAIE